MENNDIWGIRGVGEHIYFLKPKISPPGVMEAVFQREDVFREISLTEA